MYPKKVPVLPQYVINVLVFLSWTATSFCCHKCAERALRLSRDTLQGVLLLSLAQICTCLACLRYRSKLGQQYQGRYGTSVACGHVLATISTNYSLSLIPASSTFAIKLLEPITSSVFVCLTQSQRPGLSSVGSLLIIILGAFIFTGNPLHDGVLLKGVLVTVLSNIALAARNISLKKAFKNNEEVSKHTFLRIALVLIHIPCFTFVLCLLLRMENVLLLTLLISISSLTHVLYTYLSVAVVLRSVSVVTHAVLNIFKRVAVVLLLGVFGQRPLTALNISGLFLAATGLELYAESTRSSKTKCVSIEVRRSWGSRNYRHQMAFYLIAGITCFIMVQIHVSNSQFLPILEKEANLGPSVVIPEKQVRQVLNATYSGASTLHNTLNKVSRNPMIFPRTRGRKSNIKHKDDIDNAGDKKMEFPHSNSTGRTLPSNWRILNMTKFDDVIVESQRVQIDILSDLLRRFKYVVLTDIAVHENKGDAAITAGEFLLLKRLGKEVIFYCNTYACSESNMATGRTRALLMGVQNVAVLCHGGGNLAGYKEHDTLRARIFTIFHEFERFVLPQCIWSKPGNHLKEVERVYNKHPNVTLLLRDTVSMDLARKHFPRNKRFLVPDSAFQIGKVSRYLQPSYDIVWLRRTDVETAHYKLASLPPDISVTVSDWRLWLTAKGPATLENAFLIAHNGFTFLQRGRVVITDRLHGHIMCILMHMPHVLLDTSDHKVAKYHSTWTHGLEGDTVLTAVTPEDAINKAVQLLERFKDTLPSVDPFMSLKETYD